MHVDTQRAFDHIHHRPSPAPVTSRQVNIDDPVSLGFALMFLAGAALILLPKEPDWTTETGAGVIGIAIAALIGHAFGVV